MAYDHVVWVALPFCFFYKVYHGQMIYIHKVVYCIVYK